MTETEEERCDVELIGRILTVIHKLLQVYEVTNSESASIAATLMLRAFMGTIEHSHAVAIDEEDREIRIASVASALVATAALLTRIAENARDMETVERICAEAMVMPPHKKGTEKVH